MGLFENSKTDVTGVNPESLTTIYKKTEALLGHESSEDFRFVTAFAGLLGRIAYADMDISEEEISRIRKILKKTTSIKEEEIEVIVHLVKEETEALSGLENHLYSRELNSTADQKKKEEVMLSLFLVAAADKNISPEENKELGLISKSLGFTDSDFYEFRAMFKEFLSVLK